jgi:hypothetical protein
MGLLTKLTAAGGGSLLSAANGGAIAVNPLATQQSQMHANGSQPGYSVNGSGFSTVNPQFQQYNDGVANILPQPSLLDLNGATPTEYINNLPQ